jgi:hypothetical protein
MAHAESISTILPVKPVMPITSRWARRRYGREHHGPFGRKKTFIPSGPQCFSPLGISAANQRLLLHRDPFCTAVGPGRVLPWMIPGNPEEVAYGG